MSSDKNSTAADGANASLSAFADASDNTDGNDTSVAQPAADSHHWRDHRPTAPTPDADSARAAFPIPQPIADGDSNSPDGVPSFTIRVATDTLNSVMETAHKVVDGTVTLTATDDGLSIIGVDASNVSMIQADLGDGIEYTLDHPGRVGIDPEAITDALEDITRNTVDITATRAFTDSDEVVGQLTINDANTVSLVDIATVRSTSIPELGVATVATLPTESYRRGLAAVDTVSAHATFSWGEHSFHVHAEGDTDTVHVETASTTVGGTATSIYSLDHLDAFSTQLRRHAADTMSIAHFESSPDTDLAAELESDTNSDADEPEAPEPTTEFPCGVNFNINSASVTVLIAPRIQARDTDDNGFRTPPSLVLPDTEHGAQHTARFNLQTANTPILTGKADTVQQALEPLAAKADEYNLTVTPDGLQSSAADPANVCTATAVIPDDVFDTWHYSDKVATNIDRDELTISHSNTRHSADENDDTLQYDPDTALTFGVAHNRLANALSVFPDSASVSVAIDTDTRKLTLAGSGTTVNVALIDPDSVRARPSVPSVKLSASALIPTDALKKAIKATDDITNRAAFTVANGSVYAHAKASTRSDDTDVFTSVQSFDTTGTAHAAFSIDYLLPFVTSIAANSVTMHAGVKQPALFSHDNGLAGATYTFTVAPRVRDGVDVFEADLLEAHGIATKELTEAVDKQKLTVTDGTVSLTSSHG